MTHLIISREYPPSIYPQGGIGTYVAHIARLLAERGETVHVIGEQWSGAAAARQVSHGGRLIVHRVPLREPLPGTPAEAQPRVRSVLDAMANAEYPVQAFSYQAALLAESLVETEGIDCIEAQDYEGPLYYFLLRRACGLGPARRPPCFVHLHSPMQFICHFNDWDLARPDYLTMKRMEDYVVQASDAALCPSRYLGRQVEQHYGLAADSVARIPYPTGDTPRIERSAGTWAHGVICYFGRIEGRKGIFEWIDAAIIVARERPGLRFELIGSDTPLVGGEPVSVREAVEARIPDDVKGAIAFLGVRPRADLWARLAEARFAVVPSRWENFPNTCVEAMSTGLPVLSSPEGGMVEMIEDGESGWIADGVTPEALAAALRRALDTPPERTHAMGDAAAVRIRQLCDNGRTVDQQLAFRQELAARGAGRSLRIPAGHSGLVVTYGAPEGTPRPPAEPMMPTVSAVRRGVVVVMLGAHGRAAEACRASLAAQTLRPLAVIDGQDGTAALRQQLAAPGGAVGVAFVDAGCALEPRFLAALAAVLEAQPAVGVVSSWAMGLGPDAPVTAPLAPQRPYLWTAPDDLAPCVLLRAEALQALGALLPDRLEDISAIDLALAVLLSGWHGVTYPELLQRRVEPDGPLQANLKRSARTRMQPALRARFAEQVAWDAQEMLSLSRARAAAGHRAAGGLGQPAALQLNADLVRKALRDPVAAAGWAFRYGRRAMGLTPRGGR